MLVDLVYIVTLLAFALAVILGVKMRCRWIGRSVDLEGLVLAIESFFVGRGFSVRKNLDKGKKEHMILVSIRQKGRPKTMKIVIGGSSENLEIDFSVGQSAVVLAKLGFLTTMLGGGFMIRDKLEDVAFFEGVEGDFWDFVERYIAESKN
jgi:hypothetical protein